MLPATLTDHPTRVGRCRSRREATRDSVQRVVRPLQHPEDRQGVLFVEVVQDVVVVDRQVVAAADTLEQRRAGRMGIVGQRDDRLTDVAKRALRDALQLPIGAVGDVQPGGHVEGYRQPPKAA